MLLASLKASHPMGTGVCMTSDVLPKGGQRIAGAPGADPCVEGARQRDPVLDPSSSSAIVDAAGQLEIS
eukprot:510772-Pyramimonas_sp.AAC.1